jgi:hypothetical protein
MYTKIGVLLSLKENIQAVKDELNSEEKFFENAIRTERFVKKYQKPLIAAVVALVIGLGSYAGYGVYADGQIKKANEALGALLLNPSDAVALKTLNDSSKELYDLYRLSKALKENDSKALGMLKESKSPEVSDIATYENAIMSGDMKSLDEYSKQQNGLYQELAVVELAVAALQKGDIKTAQQQLLTIKQESPLYAVAQNLNHYGVK